MVDVLFSVSPISSHLERMTLGVESSSGTSELEWPQEVVGFLEVLTAGRNLVDEILNSVDLVFSQALFDSIVGLKGDSLSVDFAVASLENEFSDGFSGGIAIGYVGLNSSEHIDGGFIKFNEDTVMELSQSEESHDSDGFRVKFVNTSDSNDESDFGLSSYVDLSSLFSLG